MNPSELLARCEKQIALVGEDGCVVSVRQEAILDRDDPEAFEYVVRVRVAHLVEF